MQSNYGVAIVGCWSIYVKDGCVRGRGGRDTTCLFNRSMSVNRENFEFINYLKIPCTEYDNFVDFHDFYSKFGEIGLNIIHLNIRSYYKNFDNFIASLNDVERRCDVVALTETWLDAYHCGEVLPGYDYFQTLNKINRNDGVAVYARTGLSAVATEVLLGGVVGLELSFVLAGRPCSVLTVYRTHESDPFSFTEALADYYSNIDGNKVYIYLGDANINILNNTDHIVDHYLNVLHSLGFVQCIDKPTRVSEATESCLDHFFVKSCELGHIKSAIIMTHITDHFPTALYLKLKNIASVTSNDSNIPITFVDKHMFTENLSQADWSSVYTECVNSGTSVFLKNIGDSLSYATKIKNIKGKFKNIKPWISVGIVRSIRYRDKLSKQVKAQPFNVNLKSRYCIYRKTLTNIIKRAKQIYFRDKFNLNLNNSKMFWKTVNEISGYSKFKDSLDVNAFNNDPNLSNDLKLMSALNGFNQYFTSVGATLAQAIKDPGCEPIVDDDAYSCGARFSLRPVSEEELTTTVMGLRGGSAPGYCGVSASILKDNFNILAKPLRHIINTSITSGVFPDALKIAKVIPLYKAGSKSIYGNYRPISLLSIFSKVLEKTIKEQLTAYLNDNSILSEFQYGFRKGKNISNALFDLNRKIGESINKKKKNLIIFLDLAKAFDSVNRTLLLRKLKLIGTDELSLKWFGSYFENRQQFVYANNVHSNYGNVDYGVVQGSTLGPLLFLIFINNLTKINTNGRPFLFADDCALLLSGNSWRDVYEMATSDMTKLKLWFDQNKLTLNVNKTKYMHISLREENIEDGLKLKLHECDNNADKLVCSCQQIEQVTSYKYLGVIYDSNLRWSEHILYTKRRIRKYIYLFKKMQGILEMADIRKIYFAYVQSLLEGGIIAWGGAYQSLLEPLLTAQKCIIKIALKRNIRSSSNEIFQAMNVLDVRQLYIRNILMFLFHNRNIIQFADYNYLTRSAAERMNVVTPRSGNTHSLTNAYYVAHILYRNIPSTLRQFDAFNLSKFKLTVNQWLKKSGRNAVSDILNSIYAQNIPR